MTTTVATIGVGEARTVMVSDKWKNDKWSGGGGDTFFLRMPVVAPLSCLAS